MGEKITKKSHNTTESKLKVYSALAAGLIAIANSSEGQMVYHDIKPDTTISNGGSYLLDLNGDGISDFVFYQVLSSITSRSSFIYKKNKVEISPLGIGNKILDTIEGQHPYPPALNLNTSIGPNLKNNHFWTTSKQQSLMLNYDRIRYYTSGSSNKEVHHYKGYWQGVTDRYLGLLIEVNNKAYCGWVRLDVAKNAKSFTIKSYAYDSIPEQTVFAGDTVKTIIKNESNKSGLKTTIYTHYKDLYVSFNNPEPITGTINLFSLTGQLLKSAEVVANENHIRLEDIASGIYILNILTSKGVISRKIQIL